ncbi:unnamed protein product [Parnassius apollo]|uniref:(apollo) hypothetical protein n=1 Tax=Parnassius apollo TaxID=110799 RepID=A0A8S3WRT2_PARAO|nr:unnamed protein product [Parnassius apollo]
MNFINNRFEDIEKEQAEAKKTSKELLEDNLKMKSIVSKLNMRLISAEQRVNIIEDEIELKLLSERCQQLAAIQNNPKPFWSHVKEKRGGTSGYPIAMTNGQETTSDGFKICKKSVQRVA